LVTTAIGAFQFDNPHTQAPASRSPRI
jgi:hypothetical protein